MRYKVGSKVRIKSLDWYNENKDSNGNIVFSSKVPHFALCVNVRTVFTKDMVKYCGKVVTIENVWTANYSIVEGTHRDYFTDEMIEGLVEEENTDCEKCGLTRNSTRCLFMDNCPHNKQKNIIEIPKDYVIKDENGNVINAMKIVLEKKKKEYPKTYEECCKILGFLNVDLCFNADYRNFDASKEQWKKLGLMNQFYQLLICRDAYWKIAGEEMGLNRPWEPQDTNTFSIFYDRLTGEIEKQDGYCGANSTLEFPTEEMRDAFKENFDPDIEFCKEFL